MTYKVIRKEIKTGRIFENIVNKMQLDNICKYPSSLYCLESIEPITEVLEIKEKKETANNAKELSKIIKRGKKDLKEYIDAGTDRTFIFNWYELIKKDCQKYSESNKTCKQIYFNFLQWWNKYDKILFPDFY